MGGYEWGVRGEYGLEDVVNKQLLKECVRETCGF